MASINISKTNVGRIAERIVSNELEARGFRVSDLNKEGNSNNADLIAAKDGHTFQLQVKGATYEGGWWFGYGHCTQDTIDGTRLVFNSVKGHYHAEIVVLVCVKGPKDYQCLVLPEGIAESAAQRNLDHSFRIPRADGIAKKPGKMWVWLDYVARVRNPAKIPIIKSEVDLLTPFLNAWDIECLADTRTVDSQEPYSDIYEHAGIENEK